MFVFFSICLFVCWLRCCKACKKTTAQNTTHGIITQLEMVAAEKTKEVEEKQAQEKKKEVEGGEEKREEEETPKISGK